MALLVGMAGWTQASQPSCAAEIPFEYHDGLIWVRVNMPGSGEALHFLLDSGAAVSVFERQTALRLGLKLGDRVGVRGVGTHTTGNWIPTIAVQVGAVSVTKNFLAVDLCKLSRACDRTVDGLLGADFFRGRIVQIDYAAQTMRLLPSGAEMTGGDVLPLRVNRGALCVPVGVDGGAARWVRLDTGCAKPLVSVARGSERKAESAPVSVGLTEITLPIAPATVQLGRERIAAVPVGWHDHEIFAGEAGLLGNGLLSRYVVTIDAARGRAMFVKYQGER